MLVVVYYCIRPHFYKETICFLHTGRWQLVVFVSTVNNDYHIIGLFFGFLYAEGYANKIQGSRTASNIVSNRKLMLASIDKRDYLAVYVLIEDSLSFLYIHPPPHTIQPDLINFVQR